MSEAEAAVLLVGAVVTILKLGLVLALRRWYRRIEAERPVQENNKAYGYIVLLATLWALTPLSQALSKLSVVREVGEAAAGNPFLFYGVGALISLLACVVVFRIQQAKK